MSPGFRSIWGLIRNHYVGRTFIEPDQSIRDFGVKIKLNPSRSVIEGKRIVVIDDSIVRGTTSKKIIKMLRKYGAKEIHFRVSCPPIVNSCHYGIDTPRRERLISYQMSVEEIRRELGVDTLVFQTIEGMLDATRLFGKPVLSGVFQQRLSDPRCRVTTSRAAPIPPGTLRPARNYSSSRSARRGISRFAPAALYRTLPTAFAWSRRC